MTRTQLGLGVLIMVGVLGLVMPSGQWSLSQGKEPLVQLPVELKQGQGKFAAHCARCHGEGGVGTKQGPPLVHKIYEPNHHGDAAFQRAASSGVRAHHWNFGDMPKVEGVTAEDVTEIIRYVRWLQRQAGIM
jgi:mono/diheme cytochrome c family protein